MRIAFITDLHLPLSGLGNFGIDTRQNFIRVLSEVVSLGPDHIVIGGDLSLKDPLDQVNVEVKTLMDETLIPYSIIPGNHDDIHSIARTFKLEVKENELYYTEDLGDAQAILLDSSRGMMSHEQREFLKSETSKPGFHLVFVHHPLVIMNTPFMDSRHGIMHREWYEDLLSNCRNIYVFCGHFHVEKSRYWTTSGSSIHVTPSCYVQIDPSSKEFKMLHSNPAYRIIQVEESNIQSTVHYLKSG